MDERNSSHQYRANNICYLLDYIIQLMQWIHVMGFLNTNYYNIILYAMNSIRLYSVFNLFSILIMPNISKPLKYTYATLVSLYLAKFSDVPTYITEISIKSIVVITW